MVTQRNKDALWITTERPCTFYEKDYYMNFEFFGREIPLYGVFFWLGIFAAAVFAIFVCKRRSVELFDLASSAVYTLILAIVGAKLLYITVSWNDIIYFAEVNKLAFSELLPMIIKGGFVFYGGLIGGFLGLFIYAKQFKIDFSVLLDIYAAVLPLGHALGRVGCFFAGCCYGIHYNGPFSHIYKVPTGAAPVGISLFPVQLLESLFLLLLFGSQILLLFKLPNKKHILVYNYTFSYSIIRFVLEFFRGDTERGAVLFFSTSQWISIGVCLTTLLLFYKNQKYSQKEDGDPGRLESPST